MNSNLPATIEKKGFFAKLGSFFRKMFGIEEKKNDESKFASVIYDENQGNGINFGNGYKYDQMMGANPNTQPQMQNNVKQPAEPQKFNMEDTHKLIYENSTAFVPENYMYMNNAIPQAPAENANVASDLDNKGISNVVIPTDMNTEPVDQDVIVSPVEKETVNPINMGILDYDTERALDELDEYFADEEVASDYDEEEAPVIVTDEIEGIEEESELSPKERFDRLMEGVSLEYNLEPELEDVLENPEKQNQIKEIIEIIEENPDSLDNLDLEGLKLIDAYYKRELANIKAQFDAA